MTNVSKILNNYNRALTKLQAEAKDAIAEAVAEVFSEHEDLVSFTWPQYTQYFNDGEECHFYVHDYSVEVVVVDEEGDEIVDGDAVSAQPCYEIVYELSQHPDFAKAAFGDHSYVTFKRNEDDNVVVEIGDCSDHD